MPQSRSCIDHNLVKGVHALAARRHPELIGVVTTCLSETIRDDVDGILRKIDLPVKLVPRARSLLSDVRMNDKIEDFN